MPQRPQIAGKHNRKPKPKRRQWDARRRQWIWK